MLKMFAENIISMAFAGLFGPILHLCTRQIWTEHEKGMDFCIGSRK